jgi:hypothetical protein
MKIRQDARWPNAHVGLKRLFEERAEVSQAEFGTTFGLGTQGMVWQYLNGYTPLNYDAAAKFAKGLRCTIRDFSPDMADELEAELLPFLGRRARKVAMLALLASVPFLHSEPTNAALNIIIFQTTHCMRLLRRMLRRLVLAVRYPLVQI